jgi:hypothetical protein
VGTLLLLLLVGTLLLLLLCAHAQAAQGCWQWP